MFHELLGRFGFFFLVHRMARVTELLLVVCGAMAVACLMAAAFRGIASSPARRAVLASVRLREDVTSPHVKSQFLSKFHKAKAHHAGKSLLLDPMSDISALTGHKAGKKRALSQAQKAAIAAKMKALRRKIMGDFSSMTKFGKRVDCSYPYPAASCKQNAVAPPPPGAGSAMIPIAFGKAR